MAVGYPAYTAICRQVSRQYQSVIEPGVFRHPSFVVPLLGTFAPTDIQLLFSHTEVPIA